MLEARGRRWCRRFPRSLIRLYKLDNFEVSKFVIKPVGLVKNKNYFSQDHGLFYFLNLAIPDDLEFALLRLQELE